MCTAPLSKMAPQTSGVSALRAISFRISSATKAELPHIVAYVSQSLISCKDVLSTPESPAQKDSDAAIVLNRFNTQISTLLQDRTAEGRWAAVVLVKAAIESGGWETLRKSNAWVRGLLAILKKPDPPITRCLTIIALTRIFMLTWEYPTLIREITTPALPTFVSTCLSNLSTRAYSQDELRTTLESFAQLLPRHPTIFRTVQDAIGKLLQSVFEGPKSSLPADIKDLACRVSVLLHQCEPKGGAGEKWERSLVATVKATHAMADKTFISVEEDWQSVAGNNVNKHPLGSAYRSSQESKVASDRPVQQFVISGSDAILSNLRVLAGYFSIATPANVVVSVGQVTDLLTRLLAVTISQTTSKTSVKFNKDSSREERDALAQVLPEIHLAALEVLSTILARYGSHLVATHQTFIDQLIWIFHASTSSHSVKTAVYILMRTLLDLSGPALPRQTVASLRRLITTCCTDLLPPTDSSADQPTTTTDTTNGKKAPQGTMNADTFLKPTSKSSTAPALPEQTQHPALYAAANALLPTLLARLPATHIPVAVRSLLDRTAVLTRNKDALVASTLHPPRTEHGAKASNSLLPLLAREYPSEPAVEAILRPRMPVLETGRRVGGASDVVEDDEEEEDDVLEEEEKEDEMEVDISVPTTTTAATTAEEEQGKGQRILDAALSNYANDAAASSVGKKRTRSPSVSASDAAAAGQEGEKRRRGSPAVAAYVDEHVSGSVQLGDDSVATMSAAAAPTAEESDDDDDAFEIPQLVMGADDSEDEE